MDIALNKLSCPVCGGALMREGSSLVCTAGEKRHTYDVARSGYVNLLPPGKGKNAKSGDDAEMVRARRTFLEKGHYDRLSLEVARLLSLHCPSNDGSLSFADAGCGEGYHTTVIARALGKSTEARAFALGFDASKTAADKGAKLATALGMAPRGGVGEDFDGRVRCAFMTGNIFSLPLKDASVGAVVSMFAPIAWEENRRILTDGGVIVVAASGRDHLIELRRIIYDEVRFKEDTSPSASDGFRLIQHTNVKYGALLESAEEIKALFRMTPFSYRAPEAGVRRLEATERLEVTVDTDFYVYKLENKQEKL